MEDNQPGQGIHLLTSITPAAQRDLRSFLAGGSTAASRRFNLSCDGLGLTFFRLNQQGAGSLAAIAIIDDSAADPDLLQTLLRWAHLTENENQGVWDIDLVTGQGFFSDGWSRLRGLPPNSDLSGDQAAWASRVHPQDIEGVVFRREALLQNRTHAILDEYREQHADGHWIWVMSRGAVVSRTPDGKPRRVIGLDTEISQLKLGIDREEELNSRLALVADVVNIGVWQFDFATNQVQWDQRMRALYGIDEGASRLPGDIWETFLHPDDKAKTLEAVGRATEHGGHFDVRFRVIRKDGNIRHFRSAATQVIDTKGRRSLVGIHWDVTKETQQAEEISAAYALIKERNAELETAHNLLRHRTLHDALTGLANRHSLDQFQSDLLTDPAKKSQKCAVLQIDLDRFKAINDTLGHGAGDHVLKRFADILRNAAPKGSIVARVGGDEFAVVIAGAPHDAVIGHWANEVIRCSEEPMEYDGHSCRFSVSIGIATGSPLEDSVDNLFSRADLALYEAKRAGRGVARFFTPRLKDDARRKRQFSDDILAGLESGQFICHYQPQFDAKTLAITGLEALIRWNHPTRGLLQPGDFLDLCEELHVMPEIDGSVLETALADARRWVAAGRLVPKIYVNISGPRLRDPVLSHRIAHLADAPVPIGFELLETAFLDENDPQLLSNLSGLRALGVTIDIDDFGSGHASILSLRNLRPDRIKIDARLIRDAPHDRTHRALVQSIVEIGRILQTAVVAEGVESDAHVALLQDIGCHYLQGYGLCRPVAADEILPLLPMANLQPLRVLPE